MFLLYAMQQKVCNNYCIFTAENYGRKYFIHSQLNKLILHMKSINMENNNLLLATLYEPLNLYVQLHTTHAHAHTHACAYVHTCMHVCMHARTHSHTHRGELHIMHLKDMNLFGMVDDRCDLLSVTFQGSHNLFRLLVEHYCILISST